MKSYRISGFMISLTMIALLLTACGAPAGVISGKLVGPEGKMSGAEVTLHTYEEGCEGEDCTSEYAVVTANAQGRYEFSEVSAGRYRLAFAWELSEEPDLEPSDLGVNYRDGFFIGFMETETTPKRYQIVGVGEDFEFTGEGMVINFDYKK